MCIYLQSHGFGLQPRLLNVLVCNPSSKTAVGARSLGGGVPTTRNRNAAALTLESPMACGPCDLLFRDVASFEPKAPASSFGWLDRAPLSGLQPEPQDCRWSPLAWGSGSRRHGIATPPRSRSSRPSRAVHKCTICVRAYSGGKGLKG